MFQSTMGHIRFLSPVATLKGKLIDLETKNGNFNLNIFFFLRVVGKVNWSVMKILGNKSSVRFKLFINN